MNKLEYGSALIFLTPHATRSMAVPSFCRLELPLQAYGPVEMLLLSYIMLYTRILYCAIMSGFIK